MCKTLAACLTHKRGLTEEKLSVVCGGDHMYPESRHSDNMPRQMVNINTHPIYQWSINMEIWYLEALRNFKSL